MITLRTSGLSVSKFKLIKKITSIFIIGSQKPIKNGFKVFWPYNTVEAGYAITDNVIFQLM
jgi:hypothetical protein